MTSSVKKSSSLYLEPYIYGDSSDSHKPTKSLSISDKIVENEGLSYRSHLDKLFQKTPHNFLYIEPPFLSPEVESRLFLSDLLHSYKNLLSCWESYLKNLEGFPLDSSVETIKELCRLMAQLSRISRDISNKRYEFQKG